MLYRNQSISQSAFLYKAIWLRTFEDNLSHSIIITLLVCCNPKVIGNLVNQLTGSFVLPISALIWLLSFLQDTFSLWENKVLNEIKPSCHLHFQKTILTYMLLTQTKLMARFQIPERFISAGKIRTVLDVSCKMFHLR